MTTLEMIKNFRIGYDLINLGGPGYEDEEILILLNQAQSIEVLKEVALKRWTFITHLIENEEGQLAIKNTYAGDGSDKVMSYTPHPTTYYIAYVASLTHLKNSFITVSYQWVENILVSKENAGKYMTSLINTPILLKPRVFEDSESGSPSLTLIYDSYTTVNDGATGFKCSYIRKPTDIPLATHSEVNEILHDRIVNSAIDLAKKVINPNEAAASVQTDQLMKR
jgi:hypothetical protein